MKIQRTVKELKSTKIWKRLDQLDARYAMQTVKFVKSIAPILHSIKIHFPFYTRHDAHHGFQVLSRMAEIVHLNCFKSNKPQSFTAEELLLLICSSYAHDLGMTVFPGEKDNLLKRLNIPDSKDWETNPVLQNFLRINHSNRGGKYIDDHADQIGLPRPLVSHVDKLMRAHNLSIVDLDSQLGTREAAGHSETDLKQLACILCIADAIEFSYTRVIDGVFEKIRELTKNKVDAALERSFHENNKHFCIGDNVSVSKKDGKIVISGSFQNAESLHLAHETVDDIEYWVRSYGDIDYSAAKKRLRIRTDAIERSFHFNEDFIRVGIRMNKDNIINLVSSNSTWQGDPALVIRELLQNSVEACRYRESRTARGDSYQPAISLNFDRPDNTISIHDNGCGMTRHVIINNFLNIGNSRSKDPRYSINDYHSLARFGIGFWSVFTIAESVTIRTTAFEFIDEQNPTALTDGLEFDVEIHGMRDYTVFRKIKAEAGTSITLKLKRDLSHNISEIPARLDYHIGASKIPINIQNGNENYVIPSEYVFPDYSKIFGVREQEARIYKIEFFQHSEIIDNDIEFSMYLLYRQLTSATFLLLRNNESILQLYIDQNLNNDRISICGFKANYNGSEFCFAIERLGGFFANKTDPFGIGFTLNRAAILKNEASEEMMRKINIAIHKGYRAFLKKTNSYNPSIIHQLNLASRLHGGEKTHGLDTKLDITLIREHHPDLLCFRFYKIESGKTFQTCESVFADLTTIAELDIKVITYHHAHDFSNNLTTVQKLELGYSHLLNRGDYEGYYLCEIGLESIILLNYCVTASFHVLTYLLHAQEAHHLISIINTQKLNFDNLSLKSIQARGQHWAGNIYLCDLKGNFYYFLYHQGILVNKGSRLAKDIEELYKDNSNNKITYIIKAFQTGFVSPEIAKYF